MNDDDDERGVGGTLVIPPPADDDTEAATRLKEPPTTVSGTMQMPPVGVVDPFARTSPPGRGEFTPSGTQPLGIMSPAEIAMRLPKPVRPDLPTEPPPITAHDLGPSSATDPSIHNPQIPLPAPSNPGMPLLAAPSNPGTMQVPLPAQSSPGVASPGMAAPGLPQAAPSNPALPAPAPPTGKPADTYGLGTEETALVPPRAKHGPLRFVLGAVIGLMLTLIAGLSIVLLRTPKRAAPGSAAASASAVEARPTSTEAPAAVPSSDATSPMSTGSAAAPPAHGPEAEAIAALQKLRDGVAKCVKNTTHRLPGTSAPIPTTPSFLKSGPYKPSLRDWVSPFFDCTNFRLSDPMPFVIQWQFQKPDKEGTGIAWVDTDGDGRVDKAWAFTGNLTSKTTVAFGPIEPSDPNRKIQKPR